MDRTIGRRGGLFKPWVCATLFTVLAAALTSCDKVKSGLGPAPTDFRNAQIDVSGTACSDSGKFSTLVLHDGKYELGRYRFEMLDGVKRGKVDGSTKADAGDSAVFVGTCTIDGRTSQILFVYDDRNGAAKRLGTADLTDSGLVQSFDIKNGEVVLEQNTGNPPRLTKTSYAMLNGVLADTMGAVWGTGWVEWRATDGEPDSTASSNSSLHDFSPWPPPTPSEWAVIPNQRLLLGLGSAPTLADVSDKLVRSLTTAGYSEYSFYRVPKGFAVVARIERFDENDASPASDDVRFEAPDAEKPFSFTGYVQQLFLKARPGFYRFIVFVVCDGPVATGDGQLTARRAETMLARGDSALPASFASVRYTRSFQTEALIYEFMKRSNGTVARGIPGRFDARRHLQMSGIYLPLTGR
jgi:hypothetical protein